MIRTALSTCLVCLWCTCTALAQAAPQQSAQSGGAAPAENETPSLLKLLNSQQAHFEIVDANHWKLTGAVVLEPQTGVKLYADDVDVFIDTHKLVASGNVVFSNAEGRLSAERTEFDINTGTGTFYDASGIMSLGMRAKPAQFAGQDPDVYFYGAKIEKLGARRYRITRGGFSTCVQPTPRWEVTSDSVILNLDDYALAKNTVLHVKGVPLLYLPVIYYPISSSQRQTGFLLPTYGTSTVRGQAISNAFFWAIDRSQDATFFHDWFTRTGQGDGGEYRYVSGANSFGNVRFYRFSQKNATFSQNGASATLPATTSYEFKVNATQTLAPHVTAQAQVNYFSSLISQELYHQNLYEATTASRVVSGGITATPPLVSLSAQFARNTIFNSATDTLVYGGTPRISATFTPQRLFGSPVYGTLNTEYAFLPYQRIVGGAVVQDNSLTRVDVAPSLRVPLSRLTWLSVNTSGGFRTTYYSSASDHRPYTRDYATVRTELVGPVLDRIWEVKDSTFADRMKHVIEPAFTADVTSPINDYQRTPILTDPSDFVVGGTARLTYGVTNRFFYRAPTVNGVRGTTREFITVGIQQTYYTNPIASRFDTAYLSTYGQNPSDLSPVALNVRVSPTAAVDLNSRVEYDVSHGNGFQSVSVGGSLTGAGQTASLTLSRQQLTPITPPTSYFTASSHATAAGGRVTGTYSISWDIGRSYIVSQTVMASHMAQCCGWQVEFQRFNFPTFVGLPVNADRRLNFAFVLAGLGTFSNFFGAFGGVR